MIKTIFTDYDFRHIIDIYNNKYPHTVLNDIFYQKVYNKFYNVKNVLLKEGLLPEEVFIYNLDNNEYLNGISAFTKFLHQNCLLNFYKFKEI